MYLKKNKFLYMFSIYLIKLFYLCIILGFDLGIFVVFVSFGYLCIILVDKGWLLIFYIYGIYFILFWRVYKVCIVDNGIIVLKMLYKLIKIKI